MPEKAKITVGMFAGILRPNGKLLLRRRTEEASMLPGVSFKGCWELPGGAVYETSDPIVSYDYPLKQMMRRVQDEMGIELSLNDRMPAMFGGVCFKGKDGDYDIAIVVPVFLKPEPKINRYEVKWVDSKELNELAKGYVVPNVKTDPPTEGQGIVSGFGKRMHCLALCALNERSRDHVSVQLAGKTLMEIEATWPRG